MTRTDHGTALEATKRFLAFGGYNYYPGGGWEDFAGSFDTLDEAVTAAKEAADKDYGWWNVADAATGRVVGRGRRSFGVEDAS